MSPRQTETLRRHPHLQHCDGGNAEALKCRAYYTPKDAGASVGLAIRCASPSNKIELRATLTSAGGRVSGNWEERTFNAMGDVSGQATNTLVTVDLAEGVRMQAELRGPVPAIGLKLNAPVRMTFDPVTKDLTLPVFVLEG